MARMTEKERYQKRYSDPIEKAKINLRNKKAKYKDRYGISYEDALKIKKNGCEICGTHLGKLCVDHDHITGKIRGCLCTNCNSSLGKLKEDPILIQKLLDYIKLHKS